MKLFPRFQVSGFRLKSRAGFTVIELLIFGGLFSIISIMFLTILVSVIRVQTRQGATAEVNGQSQFLLQTVQQLVARSSLIEMPIDNVTSTLKLRMTSTTADPTYLFLQGGVVYMKETDGGAPQPITSGRVIVSDLTFIKRANSGGHDTVSVSFLAENNTQNFQQRFSQFLRMSVARVSAATFDSDLIPTGGNIFKIGAALQDWKSINNTIYFSNSNVGIGVANPGETLEVNGGLRLNTTTIRPTCGAAERGTIWMIQSGGGVKDQLRACVKNAADAYLWAIIY